ncbi:SAM-dependent methyltransferase [Arthrobacter sp. 3Tela_A]|uniref:SAM-dependent methyltransferase n=1 Tax=Arthrobacter sp. 3Tela_A TaxID=3093743 RepID=UPI003BB64666
MLSLSPIGVVAAPEDGADPDAGPALITLDKKVAPGLEGLAGFSHVVVLWWADRANGPERSELIQPLPYRAGPDQLGVFATRAPGRPNPIGMSVCRLLGVDLDALPSTPVLDLKPYTPSLDRVEDPGVPNWCAGWPRSLEESGRFDWSTVF